MDIDPMEAVENAKEEKEQAEEGRKSRLNNLVAITVAILATFLGISKVKDDNIVQKMQEAQAGKIDNWSFYQARNIREEVTSATVSQLKLMRMQAPENLRPQYDEQIEEYHQLAQKQHEQKEGLRQAAEKSQKEYEDLDYHDDQFDMCDSLLAISISLLALTSLTQKRWLYGLALIPTTFGVLAGIGGLFGLHMFHYDMIANMLS